MWIGHQDRIYTPASESLLKDNIMNQAFEIYWGIDVSKKWIDVDTDTPAIRISQTEKTIKAFIKNIR